MQAWRCHRIVPDPHRCAHDAASLRALADVLAHMPAFSRQSPLPSGYTYLGQLAAHDLTHLALSATLPGDAPLLQGALVQLRKPVLDLDSIYGTGPHDPAVPVDHASGRLVLGHTAGGLALDLPRSRDGKAMIADPRNDEHLLIAQLQVLFMRCHNAMVTWFQGAGEHDPLRLYALARRETVGIFQCMILHDLCWWLLPRRTYAHVITAGRGLLTTPDAREPTMALEVAGAALRWHAMVTPSYRINAGLRLHLTRLFTHAGHPLCDEAIVDWRYFTWRQGNGGCVPNHALSLGPRAEQFTGHHSDAMTITERTLRRGRELGLPSAQELAAHLRRHYPEDADMLGVAAYEAPASLPAPWREHTPLWAALMLEAGAPGTPHKLGPLGGWLVASTFKAAVLASNSGLADGWRLEDSPLYRGLLRHKHEALRHRIDLYDLVRFIDPPQELAP